MKPRQGKVRGSLTAAFVLLLVTAFTASIASEIAKPIPDEELVKRLVAGGYTIYFRHEATDWSLQDKVNKRDDWLSCNPARMRQLSEAGRDSARKTGLAIRNLGIPVARVFASPYCRTMESALLMELAEIEASGSVMNLRVAEYFGGRKAIIANARHLLGQAPPAGSNHVIVAHGNVAINATSIYPDEGEGLVFQADAESGFIFVGRLTPEEWRRLAEIP